jgi:hypothetical protein
MYPSSLFLINKCPSVKEISSEIIKTRKVDFNTSNIKDSNISVNKICYIAISKELGYPYSVYKGTYSYLPVHPWFLVGFMLLDL